MLPEGRLQKMGGGVVGGGHPAPVNRHLQDINLLIHGERFSLGDKMGQVVLFPPGIDHRELLPGHPDHPGITHLATAFRIKGRPVKNQQVMLVVFPHHTEAGGGTKITVPGEPRMGQGGNGLPFVILVLPGKFPTFPGPLPLLLHQAVKGLDFNCQPLFSRKQLGKVQWKTVGVKEAEGILPGDESLFFLLCRLGQRGKDLQSLIKSTQEGFFLCQDHPAAVFFLFP